MRQLISLIQKVGFYVNDGYKTNMVIFPSKYELVEFVQRQLMKYYPHSYMNTYGSYCDLLVLNGLDANSDYCILEVDVLRAGRNDSAEVYCLHINKPFPIRQLLNQFEAKTIEELPAVIESEGFITADNFDSSDLTRL